MTLSGSVRTWLAGVAMMLGLMQGAGAQEPFLRYGVANFGDVDPLKDAPVLAACGYDYIEPGLAKTVALAPEALKAARATLAAAKIPIETMNWFLPGTDIKLTGPEVDEARVRAYVERSLALAEELGAKVIVFGSPGARSFPEGFPREKAWAQLQAFLRMTGTIIETRGYGMVIGIEPLRKPESNIINTVVEAARLAREVNHPKIRIIVDFYHLAFENEDPDAILDRPRSDRAPPDRGSGEARVSGERCERAPLRAVLCKPQDDWLPGAHQHRSQLVEPCRRLRAWARVSQAHELGRALVDSLALTVSVSGLVAEFSCVDNGPAKVAPGFSPANRGPGPATSPTQVSSGFSRTPGSG